MKLNRLIRVEVLETALLLTLAVSTFSAPPVYAATTILTPIAQFSLPTGNPLDQILGDWMNQFQSFMSLVQQQMNEMLGPLQEEIAAAIEEAFGPITLDVTKAENEVLDSIENGSVMSNDAVNPVIKYQGITRTALTRAIVESHLSTDAQENSQKMLEETKSTVEQINACGETAKTAESTQDVLKAITCQQSGMASVMATAIPQLDALGRANAAAANALNDLNIQLTGEEKKAIRTSQSEAAVMKTIYSQFSFISAPEDTPSMN